MFSTLIIRAKSVRPGNIIKMAGKKYTVEAVSTYADGTVEINFRATIHGTRYSALIVDKNAPIKIRMK